MSNKKSQNNLFPYFQLFQLQFNFPLTNQSSTPLNFKKRLMFGFLFFLLSPPPPLEFGFSVEIVDIHSGNWGVGGSEFTLKIWGGGGGGGSNYKKQKLRISTVG